MFGRRYVVGRTYIIRAPDIVNICEEILFKGLATGKTMTHAGCQAKVTTPEISVREKFKPQLRGPKGGRPAFSLDQLYRCMTLRIGCKFG